MEKTFKSANLDDYDVIVLPGGVINGDNIRMDVDAQSRVRQATDAGKPIAVICHGGWILSSAGVVRGKNMTSWPSLKDDLSNAGANRVDKDVVVDVQLISSRSPDDLPAFNKVLLAALS